MLSAAPPESLHPESLHPESLHIAISDGSIHALAWGKPDAPLLVFAHATGMCAALYAPLLAPLATHHRVIAFDARGHGQTRLPADPAEIPHEWQLYRNDLKALVAALGGGPALLAGHSFGATVAFQAAIETPGLATAVLLIEPAFIPFRHAAAARASGAPIPNPMADQAARRRASYPSLAAMRQAYAGRGVFADWSDAALDAYLAGGTRVTDTAATLACDPAWESSSFRGVSTSLEASMRACRLPFALLHATEGSTVSPEDAATIAALHPDMPVQAFPGTGHFLPVTHPAGVRPFLERLAAAHPGARPDR